MVIKSVFASVLAVLICLSMCSSIKAVMAQQEATSNCSTILAGHTYYRIPDCPFNEYGWGNASTTAYSCIEHLRFVDNATVELLLRNGILFRNYFISGKVLVVQQDIFDNYKVRVDTRADSTTQSYSLVRFSNEATLEFTIGGDCSQLQDERDGMYRRVD